MKIRPAGYAAQFINAAQLIWIVLLVGCSSAERTEPPDQTSVSDANEEEGGRIRFVAAESWMESIILDPPSLDGWIALPPKHIGKLFTSSQDPGASGLLPPSACSKCHAEIVESFAATAHARTTQLPKRYSFPGSFDPPVNQFSSASGELKFEMAEAQQ